MDPEPNKNLFGGGFTFFTVTHMFGKIKRFLKKGEIFLKMRNVFAKLRGIVLTDCKEMLFADCSEEAGAFLILYRDGLGRRCVISFRREEEAKK